MDGHYVIAHNYAFPSHHLTFLFLMSRFKRSEGEEVGVLGGGLWGQLFSDSCICAEIRVSGKLLCFLFVLEFFSVDWRQMFALHNSQGRQTRREITWHNYKKWFDWVYTPSVAADLSCSQWCSLHGPRLKTHRVLVSVSFRQQSAVFNWELRTESSSTSPLSENTCWWKRSLCCTFFFQFPFSVGEG